MDSHLEYTFEGIIEFLERRTGLSRKILGTESIVAAVERAMESCGIGDPGDYLRYLGTSVNGRDKLVERVVVPETWFFRGRDSFLYLGRYARSEWLPGNPGRRFRVLSIPCSTGEEPYSVAMALCDEGFSPESFAVDAFDISAKALETARTAVYGNASFRGDDLGFRDRYFERLPEGFRVIDGIRNSVRFRKGNMLESAEFRDEDPYDAVFCRNLIIYMTPAARKRAVDLLDRMSRQGGLVFFGHSEYSSFKRPNLEKIPLPRVFACKKVRGESAKADGKTFKPAESVVPGLARSVFGRDGGRTAKPENWPAALALPSFTSAISVRATSETANVAERPRKDRKGEDVLEKARRLADRGMLEEARRLCARILEEKPLDASAHFLMGLVCQGMSEGKEAEHCFQRAVYIDPAHAQALEYLAFIEDSRNNAAKAAQLRLRARKARCAAESKDGE